LSNGEDEEDGEEEENAQESRWLCGNTLASDAHGPDSTPGGTLELDTDYHPFVGR